MAPIETVMKVRELLGSQAVTSDIGIFQAAGRCVKINAKATPDWQLEEIKLGDQEYSLPLGWKLSKTTFKLVSYLIGQPEPCPSRPPPQSGSPSNSIVLPDAQSGGALTQDVEASRKNSCVMHRIEELFGQRQ